MDQIKPVFIIGINPRCGTNYLQRILCLHPDCVPTRHWGEDFILFHADHLLNFTEAVTSHWIPEWNNDPSQFRAAMRKGIIHYLSPSETPARYVITKTPHAENAHLFLKMFDSGFMILVIRKGQDLVESTLRTFRKKKFDDAARGYRHGGELILRILNNPELMNSGRIKLVRYEDLIQNHSETVGQLLDFLKLDKTVFDFSKSASQKVSGSSSFGVTEEKFIWKSVENDGTFTPTKRADNWSRHQHYRFNHLAGKINRALGYELQYCNDSINYFLFNVFAFIPDFTHRTKRSIKNILKLP